MAGIRDIAQEVGVSISTVSHALNGTRPISSRTRQRIQDAVHRLGYRPDVRGRNLGAMRAHVVGVVIPPLSPYYIAPLLSAIDQALWECDYRMLFTHATCERACHRLFEKGQVDGLIAVISLPSGGLGLEAWAMQLKESSLPCVVINRLLPEVTCVRTDYEKGAFLAVHHLLDQGHHEIGFVGKNNADPTQVALLTGYRQAMEARGIKPLPGWVAPNSRTAFAQWRVTGRPSAVFVAGQYHTFPFYREARAQRVHIPEEIAVVGFDDDTNEADLWPGLTTVAQPHDGVGQAAVSLLMEQLSKKGRPSKHVLIPPRLVVRASCGAGFFQHAEILTDIRKEA